MKDALAEIYGWDLEYIENLSKKTILTLFERRRLNKISRDKDYQEMKDKSEADFKAREMLRQYGGRSR